MGPRSRAPLQQEMGLVAPERLRWSAYQDQAWACSAPIGDFTNPRDALGALSRPTLTSTDMAVHPARSIACRSSAVHPPEERAYVRRAFAIVRERPGLGRLAPLQLTVMSGPRLHQHHPAGLGGLVHIGYTRDSITSRFCKHPPTLQCPKTRPLNAGQLSPSGSDSPSGGGCACRARRSLGPATQGWPTL
jgi:hypothetical protein